MISSKQYLILYSLTHEQVEGRGATAFNNTVCIDGSNLKDYVAMVIDKLDIEPSKWAALQAMPIRRGLNAALRIKAKQQNNVQCYKMQGELDSIPGKLRLTDATFHTLKKRRTK